jgi:hypothetical protein
VSKAAELFSLNAFDLAIEFYQMAMDLDKELTEQCEREITAIQTVS